MQDPRFREETLHSVLNAQPNYFFELFLHYMSGIIHIRYILILDFLFVVCRLNILMVQDAELVVV